MGRPTRGLVMVNCGHWRTRRHQRLRLNKGTEGYRSPCEPQANRPRIRSLQRRQVLCRMPQLCNPSRHKREPRSFAKQRAGFQDLLP